ncbi:hypothetical protein BDV18DRAFT_163011 [Aspergillus unguis]
MPFIFDTPPSSRSGTPTPEPEFVSVSEFDSDFEMTFEPPPSSEHVGDMTGFGSWVDLAAASHLPDLTASWGPTELPILPRPAQTFPPSPVPLPLPQDDDEEEYDSPVEYHDDDDDEEEEYNTGDEEHQGETREENSQPSNENSQPTQRRQWTDPFLLDEDISDEESSMSLAAFPLSARPGETRVQLQQRQLEWVLRPYETGRMEQTRAPERGRELEERNQDRNRNRCGRPWGCCCGKLVPR